MRLPHRAVVGAVDRHHDLFGGRGRAVHDVHVIGDGQHIADTQPIQRRGRVIVEPDGLVAAGRRNSATGETDVACGNQCRDIFGRRTGGSTAGGVAGHAVGGHRRGQCIGCPGKARVGAGIRIRNSQRTRDVDGLSRSVAEFGHIRCISHRDHRRVIGAQKVHGDHLIRGISVGIRDRHFELRGDNLPLGQRVRCRGIKAVVPRHNT